MRAYWRPQAGACNQETFRMHQEKNAIVQHAVDEIILQEKEKSSFKDETHHNIYSQVGDDELYKLDKVGLHAT